jgi:hypothetical protein
MNEPRTGTVIPDAGDGEPSIILDPPQPRTDAGRQLMKEWQDGYDWQSIRDGVIAIEAEMRAETLQSVLRGLRSERDTVQLRAIIVSVEWMLEHPEGRRSDD